MTKRLLITTIVIGALAQVLSAQTVPDYINYQGRLLNGTNLYSGPVEMAFRLFNTETGGSPQYEESNTVDVVDGLYSTWIGDNSIWGSLGVALNSGTVWVEVVVNGTTLAPRERLQSVAYARYAAGLPADAVKGHMIDDGEIWSSHIMDGEIRSDDLDSGAVTSNKIGDGQIYSRHIHDATITGQDIASFAISNSHLAFNAVSSSVIGPGEVNNSDLNATAVASNVIDWSKMPAGLQDGDDNSLPPSYAENGAFNPAPSAGAIDAIAQGTGARADADYSIVGGGYSNIVDAGATSASIGGGRQNNIQTNALYATIGGGRDNNVAANSDGATIAGGRENDIGTNSSYSAIGGGSVNDVAANSYDATIAGGYINDIGTNSPYSAIGGGFNNNVADNSIYATIAGGRENDIGTNSSYSAIGGGSVNKVADNSPHATIAGGRGNSVGANATNAFAAGRRARANHPGAFVWGDNRNAEIASTNDNSVTFRSYGGFRIFTASGVGAILPPGSGSWTSLSDVNAKENFRPVDGRAILEKVAALNVCEWNYKTQDASIRHVGPMAQDFKAAFGLGESPTGISSVDADGVALAAIQGLYAEVRDQKSEVSILRAENAELKARLEQLESIIGTLLE